MGVCVLAITPVASDQLALFAQLAVTFAGFAGVIGSFSQFRMHAEATAFRVRSMVALGVGECVMALLPIILANFGLSERAVWTIAGGLLALVTLTLLVVLGRGATRLYRAGWLFRGAAYVLMLGNLLVALPLAAASLGLVAWPVPPLYFAVLFFGLTVCAYHFAMLINAVRLGDGE